MAHHVPITSPASSAHSANSTLATYQHHPADQVPRSASPPHPPLEAPPYLAHTEPRSASSSARPPSSSGNPTPRARSPAAGGLPGMSAFSPHHYAPAVMPQRSPGSRKPPPALTLHLPPVSSPTDLYYHPSTAPATFAAATAPSSPLVSASPRLACFWSLVAARDLTILCTPPSLAHHATFDDCRPCRPGTSLLDWIHPDEVHDACQDLTRLLGGPLFRGVEITCRLKLAEVDPRPATTGLPELLRRSSTSKLSELSSGRSCRGSRSAASSEFRARSASIDTLHSPGTAAGSGYTVMRLGVFALSASVALLLVHAPPTVSEGDTTPKCPCAGNTLTSADLNEVRGSLARFQDLQLPPQVEEAVSMSQNSLSAFTFTPPTPIRCVQVLTWPELDTLHTFPYAEIDRLHDQHALSLNQAPDFLHHHILTADGAASLRRTIEAAVQPDHDPLAPLYLRVRTNAPEAEPIFLGATVVPFGTLIFLLLETEMAYTVPYSPARLPSQTNPTEEPRASDEFRLPFQTGGVGASLLPDLRRHSIDVSPSSLTAPLLLPTRRLSLNPQPTDTETLSHSPGDPSSPHWDAPTGQTTPVEGNRLPKIRRVAELALEAVGANYIRPPVAESPNSPGLPSGGNLAASGMRSPLTPDSMTPLPSPSQLVAQLSMDEDYRNALRRASAGVLPPISELPKLRRFSFPLHSRPINSTAAYVEPPAETFPQPGATDSHHPTTSLTVGGSASAASVALCTTSPVYRYQPPATGSPAGGRSGDGPNRAFLPTIPEAPTEVSEGGSSGAGTMALASSEPSRKRPAVGYPAVPPSAPPISRTSTISPGVTPSAHYGPSTPVYTCYPLGGPLSPALHRTFSHELPSSAFVSRPDLAHPHGIIGPRTLSLRDSLRRRTLTTVRLHITTTITNLKRNYHHHLTHLVRLPALRRRRSTTGLLTTMAPPPIRSTHIDRIPLTPPGIHIAPRKKYPGSDESLPA
ncbi:hypothetical protein IWQ60_004053 [Tieghemiomyces parasiticus]|uniref:Uncharacterized protein n=1 Tax=Tieghemiomyces parasiticus TaxID=78921 RepID=A0A9W8DZQ1_9FUNG|nr:hypothetical protein IWQ60_004053 [Tieghemiomyces parasiticus]